MPGGLLDPDETPGETAAREVEEETGYRARSLEHLVTFEPMIGMVRNAHHVFLARGAERVGDATEVDEGRFEWIAMADVPGLIAKGRIVNSGSLVGLLHVLALSGRGGGSGDATLHHAEAGTATPADPARIRQAAAETAALAEALDSRVDDLVELDDARAHWLAHTAVAEMEIDDLGRQRQQVRCRCLSRRSH